MRKLCSVSNRERGNVVPVILWFVFLSTTSALIFVLWSRFGVMGGEDAFIADGQDRLATATRALIFNGAALLCFLLGVFIPKLLAKSLDFLVAFILRLTFFESVAICGFVVGLLEQNFMRGAPFMALGFVSVLLSFPTAGLTRKLSGKAAG